MSGYSFEHQGQRVVVDVTGQVVRAELDDRADWMERPPVPDDAHSELGDIHLLEDGHTWTAPVHASVADAGLRAEFTPLFALAIKAKSIDDRIQAALEVWTHEGAGARPGLYEWLPQLRERLADGSSARALLDAAAHLAGSALPEEPPAARLRARKWLANFHADSKASKPLGIYTQTESLAEAFRHDRILQSKLEAPDAQLFREALEAATELRSLYEAHLELIRRVTGPFPHGSVMDTGATAWSFFPPSDSLEGRLIKELFGAASVPDGFKLAEELVVRIRDGRLATSPKPDDGWYGHQFHAIAALLRPETEGLEVGPRYRQELEETFQALFTLNRETHVKQLESPAAGGSPLIISPSFTVEPVPEYYERVASAYRFLRAQLSAAFGEAVLRSAPEGRAAETVLDLLVQGEMLLRGAAVVSRQELGQSVQLNDVDNQAATYFRSWQRSSPQDPDMTTDMRVAVPVFYDVERKTVRICATLGVETRTLGFEFVKRPSVKVHRRLLSFSRSEPVYWSATRSILSPITLECDVKVPPSRDELRRACDQHKTPQAIRVALEQAQY